MTNPMQPGPAGEGRAPDAPERSISRAPSMQVATRIVATLAARDLIAPEQSDALQRQIAAGVLTPDDWIQIARRAVAIDSAEGGRDD